MLLRRYRNVQAANMQPETPVEPETESEPEHPKQETTEVSVEQESEQSEVVQPETPVEKKKSTRRSRK